MKKYLSSIILGVIIVILAVAIGCLYFSDKKETTETTNIPVETSEPVATATPEPTPTTEPTQEPTATPESTEEPTPETTYPTFEELYGTQEEREEESWQSLVSGLGITVEEAKAKYGGISIDNPEDRAAVFLAENLGLTFEEAKAMLANGGEIDSPYLSDRKGYRVGDTVLLDNGVTLAYQGEDIWKDVASNTKYKPTKELEDGGLWFEQQGTQQASNPDSPYISDRCGYNVGQVYGFDAYEIKYLGEDRWYDEWNQTYYTAIPNANGGFDLRTDEYLSRVYAKEGETPVSERLGYQPGDYITYQSLGFTFNRIYEGNDIWYDDNRPGSQMRAYIDANGNIGFSNAN